LGSAVIIGRSDEANAMEAQTFGSAAWRGDGVDRMRCGWLPVASPACKRERNLHDDGRSGRRAACRVVNIAILHTGLEPDRFERRTGS
jgi:hypothetical protein